MFSRLMSLPRNLQEKLVQGVIGKEATSSIIEAALVKASKDRVECSKLVRKGIASIVRKSSITQSIKGIITAGGNKTLIYSAQKIFSLSLFYVSQTLILVRFRRF